MSIKFLTAEDLIDFKNGDKVKLATPKELGQSLDFLSPSTKHIFIGDPYIIDSMKRNFGKEITFIEHEADRNTHFKADDGYNYDIRWCTSIHKQSKHRWKR